MVEAVSVVMLAASLDENSSSKEQAKLGKLACLVGYAAW